MSDKICFVIAPIGDPDSDVRKRSDQVLKHVIRPAVSERSFKAIRADEISEPGIITSQVIQHIVDAPLVVADLTGRNPNVFYELAVRHALRKPLIQIIHRGEPMPFDVAGMRTIPVDHRDLDSVEEARKEIVKQIDAATAAGSRMETPISVAVELQSLRQSDDPDRRSLADIISGISDLRSSIAGIELRLAEIAGTFANDALDPTIRCIAPISDWLSSNSHINLSRPQRSFMFTTLSENDISKVLRERNTPKRSRSAPKKDDDSK